MKTKIKRLLVILAILPFVSSILVLNVSINNPIIQHNNEISMGHIVGTNHTNTSKINITPVVTTQIPNNVTYNNTNYSQNYDINLSIKISADFPQKSPLNYPWRYPEGACELAAKQFQQAYGGDLIFVQPLKPDGSFDLGGYNGKWLNYVFDKNLGKFYYIDYEYQRAFSTREDFIRFAKVTTGITYVIYDVNKDVTPFPIIYHY